MFCKQIVINEINSALKNLTTIKSNNDVKLVIIDLYNSGLGHNISKEYFLTEKITDVLEAFRVLEWLGKKVEQRKKALIDKGEGKAELCKFKEDHFDIKYREVGTKSVPFIIVAINGLDIIKSVDKKRFNSIINTITQTPEKYGFTWVSVE